MPEGPSTLAVASNAHSFRMTPDGGWQRREYGKKKWHDLCIIRDQSSSPKWVWAPSKETEK